MTQREMPTGGGVREDGRGRSRRRGGGGQLPLTLACASLLMPALHSSLLFVLYWRRSVLSICPVANAGCTANAAR